MDKPTVSVEEASQEYDAALKAAGGEPEPRLIYGLVLLKYSRTAAKVRTAATNHFEVVKSELPDRLLPCAALAWLGLEKRTSYPSAVRELTRMIEKVPKPASPGQSAGPLAPDPFEWAGRLREYAWGVADPPPASSPQLAEEFGALDSAVAARGPAAVALYNQGRRHSHDILADFDSKIAAATEEADRLTLGVKRKQLANYAEFPLSQYKDQVLAHLDE